MILSHPSIRNDMSTVPVIMYPPRSPRAVYTSTITMRARMTTKCTSRNGLMTIVDPATVMKSDMAIFPFAVEHHGLVHHDYAEHETREHQELVLWGLFVSRIADRYKQDQKTATKGVVFGMYISMHNVICRIHATIIGSTVRS